MIEPESGAKPKRSSAYLIAFYVCAFFVIGMAVAMHWIWHHPRVTPAMALSRGNRCSIDGKTWWPARNENGQVVCYLKDKP
jgi:hypothetical protein